MKSYGISDKGKIRRDNQDAFSIIDSEERGCVIVALCDGMGGQKAGGVASEIAKRAFTEYVEAKLRSKAVKNPDLHSIIKNGCAEANEVVYYYSRFDEKYSGMGTTLVGGIIKKDGSGLILNVGDSRAYVLSKKKKTIRQVTVDHSYVEELVRKGLITREQARTHPRKNVITRALGTEKTVQSDVFEIKLNKGELLLLCSDGLTNYVTDEEILDEYLVDSAPEAFCRGLLSMSYFGGGGDNITIVAVEK